MPEERQDILDLLSEQLPDGMSARLVAEALDKNYRKTRCPLRKRGATGEIVMSTITTLLLQITTFVINVISVISVISVINSTHLHSNPSIRLNCVKSFVKLHVMTVITFIGVFQQIHLESKAFLLHSGVIRCTSHFIQNTCSLEVQSSQMLNMSVLMP